MKHRIFAITLICCLIAAAVCPAAAEGEVTPRSLIERIAVSYAADGTRDEESDFDALVITRPSGKSGRASWTFGWLRSL